MHAASSCTYDLHLTPFALLAFSSRRCSCLEAQELMMAAQCWTPFGKPEWFGQFVTHHSWVLKIVAVPVGMALATVITAENLL